MMLLSPAPPKSLAQVSTAPYAEPTGPSIFEDVLHAVSAAMES